jgi:hypothetical protein
MRMRVPSLPAADARVSSTCRRAVVFAMQQTSGSIALRDEVGEATTSGLLPDARREDQLCPAPIIEPGARHDHEF